MAGEEREELKAYGYVAVAGVLWGGMGVMAKFLYADGVSPWTLVFFRAAMGTLACGLVILLVDRRWLRIRLKDLPFLAVYGLVSTSVFFSLYLYTISITTVAVAVVLLYTAPVFASIMGRLVYGEPLALVKLLALALCFAGCVLVTGIESGQLVVGAVGILTGLGSAVSYASFGIMGKHARRRYNPVTILFYAMGFATIFLIPVLALPGASLGPFSWQVWALMVAIAAGPTLVARVLFVAALKHVEASRAAIVATVEPVTAAILAALILGELLAPVQVFGGALVIAGSVLAQQSRIRGKPFWRPIRSTGGGDETGRDQARWERPSL